MYKTFLVLQIPIPQLGHLIGIGNTSWKVDRFPQHLSWLTGFEGALFHSQLPVEDYKFDPLGVLVWGLKSRFVCHPGGVEYHDIRLHTLRQDTEVTQPHRIGGEPGHFQRVLPID